MKYEYPNFSFSLLLRGIYNTYRLSVVALKSFIYFITSRHWFFYKKTISLIENQLEKDGKTLEKSQKKRLFIYSFVGSVLFGASLRILLGKRLSYSQQEVSQYFACLTPIIDDLNDDFFYSDIEIKHVAQKIPQRVDNIWEKIAILLEDKIEKINKKSLWQSLTQKTIDFQIQSKLQENGSLDGEKLRMITYGKGGSSVQLSYEVIIDDKASEVESDGFFQLGVIIQLINDIFDVYKDRNSNLQTIVTDSKDIRAIRREYDQNVKNLFDIFYQLPYGEKNIHDFLLLMSVLISRGWVALDQLEQTQKTTDNTFLLHSYSRKQLITDMEKVKNLWRAFIYNITCI